MKTLLCTATVALALTLGLPASAQDKPASQLTTAELLARIQTDKRALVEKGMNLTPEEAKKFWPLYDQFQRELEVQQRAYNRAVLDFLQAGASITDANAKRLAEEALAATTAEAKLREKHFRQLLKVLPARQAARYVQIENKLQAVVRFEAAKIIPLVP
jgi:Spy/CpxP family protein refolding chaperone